MAENNYLLVAVYNHAHYRALSDPERDAARSVAAQLFGYRVYGEDGEVLSEHPVAGLGQYFTAVAAFPYVDIPQSITETEKEAMRARALYGWLAIMTEAQRAVLIDRIATLEAGSAFKNPLLSQVFDIQTFAIGPDLDGAALQIPFQNGAGIELQADESAWQKTGLDVYDEQTPAMWRLQA